MQLRVLRCRPEKLLGSDARRVGIELGPGVVASQRIGLGEHDAPGVPVPVERARREPQEHRLLPLVQHPHEVPKIRHVRREPGGLYLFRRRPEHRPRPRQVALRERDHRLPLQQAQVCRGEGQSVVVGLQRLGVTAEPDQDVPEPPSGTDGAGVEPRRLSQMLERRLPAAHARLDERRDHQQIRVGRCESLSLGVLLQRLRKVAQHEVVVGTQRDMPLRAIRS